MLRKKGEAAKVAVRKFVVMQMSDLRKLAKQDVSEDEIKELEETRSRRAQIHISKKLMRQ